MKVGDLVRFSQAHRAAPGLNYTGNWVGLLLKIDMYDGKIHEYQILWTHGIINDYPAAWFNTLPYEPFEVFNESR